MASDYDMECFIILNVIQLGVISILALLESSASVLERPIFTTTEALQFILLTSKVVLFSTNLGILFRCHMVSEEPTLMTNDLYHGRTDLNTAS